MSNVLKKLIIFLTFLLIILSVAYYGYRKWQVFVSLRKAKKDFYIKDYQSALKVLSNIGEISRIRNKRDLDIVYMQAVTYMKTGRKKESVKEWKKIISAEGFSDYKDEACFFLGKLLWESGEKKRAIEYFERVFDNFKGSRYVGDSLYYLAVYNEEIGNIDKAHSYYKMIVEKYPDAQEIEKVMDRLGELNIKMLYEGKGFSWIETYVVKPGDSLEKIAKKYNTTVALIKKMNKLKSHRIRPYDRLKVANVKFSIAIDKSLNILILKANGEFFKRYYVGTGKHGSTPVGKFKITGKIVNPTWYKPDGGVVPFGSKENLLGTRWMSINYPGYGIHGTWDPDSVGKQSSMGCIRLKNKEVEELFDLVPVGTEVTIVD